MTGPEAKTLLSGAFGRALSAADPITVLPHHLPAPPEGRLVVVGAGKAAAKMAAVTETFYKGKHPDAVLEGLVVTRYGHGVPTEKIRVMEASHPVPDAAGVEATRKLLELARPLTEHDLLLCLVSGGASALLCAPEGVTLEEKAALTTALLRSGADIHEMNTVRKHLSSVKGGGLAKAAFPARALSLIISDVAGDDLSVVASGPTVPDLSTFAEARAVLQRYGLEPPARLIRNAPETPKPGDPIFDRVENRLIASAQGSLEAAAAFFREQGVTPLILSESVTGEAREVAKVHAAIARQIRQHGQPLRPPCVLLSGGETTVTVRGTGRGGRNAEFALSLVIELDGLENVYALAADSDGRDGLSDGAGVIITPETLADIGKAEARRCLDNNDAYEFFERICGTVYAGMALASIDDSYGLGFSTRAGCLIRTGPTLTNVNDMRFVLVL